MKNIIFEKYHGNGNDFIIIDTRNKNIFNKFISENIFDIKELCDRQFGIGGDGLIFILEPNGNNHARMIIYNSDGSEAQMCGNGIRCLVQYLHNSKKGSHNSSEYRIETKAGLKIAQYNDGQISVKMGKPIIDIKSIPTNIDKKQNFLPAFLFKESNFEYEGYAVGMGNPHLIFFVEDITKISLSLLGPVFENHKLFPEKTNVHFSQIINRDTIKVLVWERGAGATLACGTGACAVHVAAFNLGLCNSETIIILPGGNLKINWSRLEEEIVMSGTAKKVFSGNYFLN
ncbi:Diaminopimelate epimerase [Prochlorococcus marinus str. MIT 9515]|uniref:Diaminopimelate epimerase n=1 Tax=Prochlorococcus marinus (strain MIT 9515) TaxID=167542 RepID=A2BWL6_PROM5|nr:diaminopimelate epimerase [Prochlorococcus marinus]ABM72177.1 Diaminopimelate epimerase [Prochlorococcus marinus str. MIT 9515]